MSKRRLSGAALRAHLLKVVPAEMEHTPIYYTVCTERQFWPHSGILGDNAMGVRQAMRQVLARRHTDAVERVVTTYTGHGIGHTWDRPDVAR